MITNIINNTYNAKNITRDITGKYADKIRLLKVGSTFTERAFSSTSGDKNIAKSFSKNNGVVLIIKVPKGYGKRISLSSYSMKPEESEILLNSNARFKIERKSGNNIFVKML